MSRIPFSKLKASDYTLTPVPYEDMVVGETYYCDPLKQANAWSITIIAKKGFGVVEYDYAGVDGFNRDTKFGPKYAKLSIRSGHTNSANLTKYQIGKWKWNSDEYSHPATQIFRSDRENSK